MKYMYKWFERCVVILTFVIYGVPMIHSDLLCIDDDLCWSIKLLLPMDFFYVKFGALFTVLVNNFYFDYYYYCS